MEKIDVKSIAAVVPVYAATSKGAPLTRVGYRLFDARNKEIGAK